MRASGGRRRCKKTRARRVFYVAGKLLVRRKANAADGRSRAVEAQVSTAAGELALTVAGEPVSIQIGELAGTGAEELAAP